MPTQAALEAMFAQQTKFVMLAFLTVYDQDYARGSQPEGWPIRLVKYEQAITGPGSFTFSPCLFDVQLPDEQRGGTPEMRISALGPAEDLIEKLRAVEHAPEAKLELASYNPETATVGAVEKPFDPLRLREVMFEGMSVSFTFRDDELSQEPIPRHRVSPLNCPGAF